MPGPKALRQSLRSVRAIIHRKRSWPLCQAIENGIGDGGIADDLVPVLDGELAGYDGRASAVAILHDLQHVAALIDEHRLQSPVVEDEQLDAGEHLEKPGMLTITACECERIEEAPTHMRGQSQNQNH